MSRICSVVALVGLVFVVACGEEVDVGPGEDVVNNEVVNNDATNNEVVNNDLVNNDATNNDATNNAGCSNDAGCELGEICEAGACVAGCRDSEGCTDGTFCSMGTCVGCVADDDCSAETVCEASACVAGCRDDAGCFEGRICEAGGCQDGCREDNACDAGQICEDNACEVGCREDAACGDGMICLPDATCADGCREDGDCGADLCVETSCVARGIACRDDVDCNGGDVCDLDTTLCVAGETPCEADALEPNDTEASTGALGTTSSLSICEGDVDRFAYELLEGERVDVEVAFNGERGGLVVALRSGEVELALGAEGGAGLVLSWTAEVATSVVVEVAGADASVRNSYTLEVGIMEPQLCDEEVRLYSDADLDGYGAEGDEGELVCVVGGERPEGYADWASVADDCAAADPTRHPDADEICGDQLDDDCDGADADCPTTRPSVVVPSWSCEDDSPPSSVYAWARFSNGNGYFQDGGCFVFFEGLPGEFYVKGDLSRVSQAASCETINGCVCPSLNGWSSYDRRLYALTSKAPLEDCPDLWLVDHAGQEQVVSNACRKYLLQLHWPGQEIPFSFVAAGEEALRRRLDAFSTVEVACLEDRPHRNLPYATLMTAEVTFNANFE